jgi:hypothetical protein
MRGFGVVTLTLGACVVTACPVDDRTLTPIEVTVGNAGSNDPAGGAAGDDSAGGDAGSSAGTNASEGGEGGHAARGGSTAVGGTSGSGGTSTSGGTAGSCSTWPGGGPGCGCGGTAPLNCPDIDGNQVADCDETLADNASFDEDAAAWVPDTGVESTWLETDSRGSDESGALGLRVETVVDKEGTVILGARQCFSVSPGAVYKFAVETSVPDDAGDVRAGFQLVVHDGPLCGGALVDNVLSSFLQGSTWSVAQLTYLTPTSAKSIAMRLIAQKPFRADPVTVQFDNALVRTE